ASPRKKSTASNSATVSPSDYHVHTIGERRFRRNGSQLDKRWYVSGLEQRAPDGEREVVGVAEQAVEQHRALQIAVKRMIGRKADTGEHLLAVRGDRARRTARDRLRQRRSFLAGSVGGGDQCGVECFDRDERVRESVAHGLESLDRRAELHSVERVLAR